MLGRSLQRLVVRPLQALWGEIPGPVRAEALSRGITVLMPTISLWISDAKGYPFWIQVNLFVASIILARVVLLIAGYVYTRNQMRPAFAVILHSGARDGFQIGRWEDIEGADYVARLEVTAPRDVRECSAVVTAVHYASRGPGEHRLMELASEHNVRLRWEDNTSTATLNADAPRVLDLAIIGEDDPDDDRTSYFTLARPGGGGHRYPHGVYRVDVVLSGQGIRKRTMRIAVALIKRRSRMARPVINLKWWDDVGAAWLANDERD